MAFPENFIQELTERNDIVDVVGSYVSLGKRSGANLFGLCPFSFMSLIPYEEQLARIQQLQLLS